MKVIISGMMISDVNDRSNPNNTVIKYLSKSFARRNIIKGMLITNKTIKIKPQIIAIGKKTIEKADDLSGYSNFTGFSLLLKSIKILELLGLTD